MPAIQTDGLTKRYDGGLLGDDVTAVDHLDLRVQEGEVYGFLGPNGAGKSTTIDMLLDFGRPTSGSATILGYDAQAEPNHVAEHVGVLPDGYNLYDRLTGRRNLELAAEWQGVDADLDRLLTRVGLDPSDATRPVGGYSKGMSQRVALAMALVGDPDLLILDEPSSGLDPNGIQRLQEIVREEADDGTTVFFSSHILGQVDAVCDRVGILDDGKLVAVDTVDGLREAAGASSVLELTLQQDARPELLEGDCISNFEARDNRLRITCTDSRAKARIISKLVDRGHELIDVKSEAASLSEVFATYTGENAQREPEADREQSDEAVTVEEGAA